jgi:hypothetical protein
MPNAGGINVSLTEDFFPKPLLFWDCLENN